MQIIVTHPDQQFTGDIVGVRFEDGTATIDTTTQGAAYGYFQRAGYGLVAADEPLVAEVGVEPDADATEPGAEDAPGATDTTQPADKAGATDTKKGGRS